MIMAMKNKLLKNKNFDQLLIHNKRDRNPVKKLRAILRPFKSPTDFRWAEFSYPDSDKKLLVSVYLHIVWFKGPCYEPDEGEKRLVKLFENELDYQDYDEGDVIDIDESNEPDVNDPSDVEDDEQATDEEDTSSEDEDED
ncbi:hypothetical protein CAEBREN_01547 [Caenorhabditis brenneri]|uniref:Uncharacterized protein n=1 Tax=Caenorhabditis brenneri TaxID=135651 RepID=G0N889_CAEBE|nr:hypothetical protein CAEBREN_01547 [Caenorhabditis brenneri]